MAKPSPKPRKRGRPTVVEQKRVLINFRVTASERERLRLAARAARRSMARLVTAWIQSL